MIQFLKHIYKKNNILFMFLHYIYSPIRFCKTYRIRKLCEKEALRVLKRRDLKKATIFFLGVPLHHNLGDIAQTYCIYKYFLKYWNNYEIILLPSYSFYSRKVLNKYYNNIREEDLIFFQSGYCTTDIHIDHTMHKKVIEKFINTKIIFFPQTVLFRNKIEKNKTAQIFNSHGNILFLARDNISYRYANKMFENLHVKCFPDIVTTLIGSYDVNSTRDGILLCLRNDTEKMLSKSFFNRMKDELKQFTSKIDVTDTECNVNLKNGINEEIKKAIFDKIDSFSHHEVVITDRYHGTIFSLIANTPVIVLETNDHKVRTGIDWFGEVLGEKIFLANTCEDVILIIKQLRTKDNQEKYFPNFEERYYSKLKEMIDQM